uniref:SURF1-like protein n=1 Tax=Homalodisca liturata TaxID=320908 RepID=A0A1B6I8V3_9HEMI
MLNLTKQCYPCFQRIVRCASETCLIKLKYTPNSTKVIERTNVFRINQVSFKSTFRPPPGVTPFEPKPIPFVQHKMQRRGGGGGNLLMLIPIITFGLGVWQVKRLKWKTELIKTIEERSAMDPVPLPLDPAEVAQMEFQKVTVKGTFDHENELFYGPKQCLVDGEPNPNVVSKTGEASYGYNLITPFVLSDSGERILVNRGWIVTKTVNPEKRPWSKTEGEQTITGVVRNPEPVGMVAPATSPKYKIWHFRDIADMAEKRNCLPIYIDATVDHSIPGKLWGGQTRYHLRNEHLSYIITWFSLSAATSYMWYIRYAKRK